MTELLKTVGVVVGTFFLTLASIVLFLKLLFSSIDKE